MSFQDPFAGDLQGFKFDPNAPAAPRVAPLVAPQGSPNTMTAAPAAADTRTRRPAGGAAEPQRSTFWGTPQSFTFGGVGGSPASSTPAAAVAAGPSPALAGSGAPVSGRRAGPVSAQAAGADARGLGGAAAAAAAPTSTTSALSWLDEPAPLGRRAQPASQPSPPSLLNQQQPVIAAAVHDDPLSFLDPDADRRAPLMTTGGMGATAGAAGVAAGLMSAEEESLARAQAARLEAAQRAQAEKLAKAAELRDAYAALDAVEMELDQLNDKLDTQGIKEEAELTELETTALMKRRELEEQEAQVEVQVTRAHAYGERQVAELRLRFEGETAAMRRDVRELEGGRQQRQLKQLKEALQAQETVLQQLRRQRDLIAQTHPFEAEGIRIAIAMSAAQDGDTRDEGIAEAVPLKPEEEEAAQASSMSSSASQVVDADPVAPRAAVPDANGLDDFFNEFPDLMPTEAPHEEATHPETAAQRGSQSRATTTPSTHQAQPRSASSPKSVAAQVLLRDAQQRLLRDPTVDEAMSAAVDLLQRYVATHLGVVKDEVVGCVHSETLSVAHAVRLKKREEWAQDVLARKKLLSEHELAAMAAARERARERNAHAAGRLQQLHEILQEGRRAVRAQAKARLEKMQSDVSARLTYATTAFATEAERTWTVIEKELQCTLEGDAAMAAAQRTELEQRLSVERRVRRQLYTAQQESLSDHLSQTKRKSEETYQARLRELLESIGTLSGRHTVGELRAGLQAMRDGIVQQRQQLSQDAARRADGREPRPDDPANPDASHGATSEASMHLQELRHQLRTLLQMAQDSFDKTKHAQLDTEHIRQHLLSKVKNDLLTSLRERRSAQQSHSSQIDYIRLLWEREHRQNLQAGHALELLLGRSPSMSRAAESGAALTTASTTAETRVYPQQVSLTLLLEALCDKLGACTNRGVAQREQRRRLQQEVHAQIATEHAQHGEVQLLWAAIYEQLLRIHDEQRSLSSQTCAVTEESVRLENEKQRIELEAEELERRLMRCRQEGTEAREIYAATLAQYQHFRNEMDRLADQQLALAQEQNLLQLQGGGACLHTSTTHGEGHGKRVDDATPSRHAASGGDTSEEEGGLSPEQPPPRPEPHTRRTRAPGEPGAVTRRERARSATGSPSSADQDSAHVSPIIVRRARLDDETRSHASPKDTHTRPHSTSSQHRSRTATPPTWTRDLRHNTAGEARGEARGAAAANTEAHRTPPRPLRQEKLPKSATTSPAAAVDTSASTNASAQQPHESSGVSATSLYRTSFMDLLSVLDSTTTSFSA